METLNRRLENARYELTQQDSYDYKVVNRDLTQAVREVAAILQMRLLIKQHVTSFPSETVQRMMSYNIRMAPCDEDEGTENSWEHRDKKIQAILDHYRPDIVGVQEISEIQTKSFRNYTLLVKYPSRKPFELGLAIAYQTDKLQPLSDLRVVWLNELKTGPDSPSWDGSAYERFLIYAKFKTRSTGDAFWFMTTHFDHLGVKARQESAKIVMDLAESLDAPAVVSGDFNCFPQLGGSELYNLLTSRSTQIKDTGICADRSFGPLGSWRGWDYDPYMQRSDNPKYDYLFVHKSIKVLQHGVIDDCVWDDHFGKPLYPSDHLPVMSDIILRSHI
jgi:endonuclease/exonuclease/phosphatase family metal-dependent hydrolase